jgi:DNA primase
METPVFVDACHKALAAEEGECKQALDYLRQARGLTQPVIDEFSLGYCASRQAVPDSRRTDGMYNENDALRHKIIVPIYSEFGILVGAAARSPNPDEKGWWNTKFRKEHQIFLFNKSRKAIYESNLAIVFEGYMDALVAWQMGIHNCCAIMGTNLGYRRIGLLARYCDRICFCLDNDHNDAGLLGELKSMSDLWRFGLKRVTKIELPQGVDPDEYLLKCGVEAFHAQERQVTHHELRNADKQYEELREKKRKQNLEQKEQK